MDPFVISHYLRAYDKIMESTISQYLAKKFEEMPKQSKYHNLFADCRNALSEGSFINIREWLDYTFGKFSEVQRKLDPSSELSFGLETLYQILEEKMDTKYSLTPDEARELIIKTNSKVREIVPTLPDSLEEFKRFQTLVEPPMKFEFEVEKKPPVPHYSPEELDELVSKLRRLKTDSQVAEVMDILQRYDLQICKDKDEQITVNFKTLDPITTSKVKQYVDKIPQNMLND